MGHKLKILVWENAEGTDEEPLVDVTIPTYMAKWGPRMMKFVPRHVREEMWGEGADLSEFNFEELIQEAINSGESEIMEIKARDPKEGKRYYIKIFLQE